MSAIEQEIRYLLYHLQQQTLPHGGLSHHQELFALQWDGSEAALNRLDECLIRLKNGGETLPALLQQAGGKNFLLTVAACLVDYLAGAADQIARWLDYQAFKEQFGQNLPPLFRHSLIARFNGISCLPLAAIELCFNSQQNLRYFATDSLREIRQADLDTLPDDANTVCRNFLRKVRSGRLTDSAIAFYDELQAVHFDYSVASIDALDRVLAEIKIKYQITTEDYEDYINQIPFRAFLLLIGCYTGATAARAAEAAVKWFNYPQMQEIVKDTAFVHCIEHSQVMMFEQGYYRTPLLAVTNQLFDLTEDYDKTCRTFVNKVLAENRSRISSFTRDTESDIELPPDWETVGELAGELAGWNMLSAFDNSINTPKSIILDDNGKKTIVSHMVESAEDMQALYQKLADNPRNKPYALLSEDIYINLPGGRTDAIAIQLQIYTEPKLSLRWIVPYRNAENPRGFVIYPLVNNDGDIPLEYLPALAQAFYRGARAITSPFHETDFWSVYAVDSHDLFIAEPPAAVWSPDRFQPESSKIILFTELQHTVVADSSAFPQLDSHLNINQAINRLQANQRHYLQTVIPEWMKTDDLFSQISAMPKLYREGKVVWAAVVQANNLLFSPDNGASAPAEVVFDPTGQTSPEQLIAARDTLYALKNTQPEDEAARRYAEHLTGESSRLFNFPYPQNLGENDLVCSTVWIWCMHLPDGMLSMPVFPILYHPDTDGRIMPLPARFWPEALYRQWIQQSMQEHGSNCDLLPTILAQEKQGSPFESRHLQNQVFPPLTRLFPNHEAEYQAYRQQHPIPDPQRSSHQSRAANKDWDKHAADIPIKRPGLFKRLMSSGIGLLLLIGLLGMVFSKREPEPPKPTIKATVIQQKTAVAQAAAPGEPEAAAHSDSLPNPTDVSSIIGKIHPQLPYTPRLNTSLSVFDMVPNNSKGVMVSLTTPALMTLASAKQILCNEALFEPLRNSGAAVVFNFHRADSKAFWFNLPVSSECR